MPVTATRMSFVASVVDPAHVDTALDVVGTNLLLALIVLLLVGVGSAIFNSTLDENRVEIDGWVSRVGSRSVGWTEGALALLRPAGANGLPGWAVKVGRLAVILVLTAVVYGFLSPDFALDGRSAVLFAAFMAGLGIVTYVSEGSMAAFSVRRLHVPAGVRVYGAALAVAVGCVLLSRLMDFRPGILYGFIASFVILAPVTLQRRGSAELVLMPSLCLLGASLVAWGLLVPLRSMAVTDGSWFISLLEATAAIVFVAGLEGVFFNLIPIDFMDGAKIARWNPVVWAVLFGFVTFLFWQLLLNRNEGTLDAIRRTRVVAALGVAAFYAGLTVAAWGFFQIRNRTASRRRGS